MPKIKNPTRNDLNEKIQLESAVVFSSASEDDLTNYHSQVEVKSKIRNALLDTSMTDEMVQALYIKDDILTDAYCFFTEYSKDNQVHLAVWDYLDKAEHDHIAEMLYERIEAEHTDFIRKIKLLPPEKIVENAYRITIMDEILCCLDPGVSDFDTEKLKALLSLEHPLDGIYYEWMDNDRSIIEDLEDTIRTAADRIIEEKDKANSDDNELDYEDEDEDEQEL